MIRPAIAFVVCFAAVQGGQDLSRVLARIEQTRSAELAERRAAARALTRLRGKAARRASLALYRREANPVLRAIFLEHAGSLGGLDELMLRELEKGADLDIRAVAAGYFCTQHGDEGVDLCLSLLAERRSPELERAVLVAFARQKVGSKAANQFVQRFRGAAPSTQHLVLKACRGNTRSQLETVRKAALESTYAPLKAEALIQLSRAGYGPARRLARKLATGKPDKRLAPALFEAIAADCKAEDLASLGGLLRASTTKLRRAVASLVTRIGKSDWARGWALDAGRTHAKAAVRAFALEFLMRWDSKPCRDAIYDLASDVDDRIRRRAVLELAKRKDERVRGLLEKHLARGRVEQRLDALEGLALLAGKDPEFDKRLLALAEKSPLAVRLLAIDIGSRRGLRELLPSVPKLLRHPDWRVRLAGVQVAKRVRDASSVPLLIDALAASKGRLGHELRAALAALTRLFFQSNRAWIAWWKKDGATFALPPAEAAKPAPKKAESTTSASFYGIPVYSERVAYCLDVSGSMSELSGTGISRMKVAKEALIQTLKRSPKNVLVGVYFFETKVHAYSKRMVSLKRKKDFDKLAAFIRSQKALGGTNVYDAVLRALADKRVDTVFLVSDGEPSSGDITDIHELADELLRLNRSRKVVFHCVSIGRDSALLQRLADETGGTYVMQK